MGCNLWSTSCGSVGRLSHEGDVHWNLKPMLNQRSLNWKHNNRAAFFILHCERRQFAATVPAEDAENFFKSMLLIILFIANQL